MPYRGLACTECPAYIAKRTGDGALRAKTAEERAGIATRTLVDPARPFPGVAPMLAVCGGGHTMGVLYEHFVNEDSLVRWA